MQKKFLFKTNYYAEPCPEDCPLDKKPFFSVEIMREDNVNKREDILQIYYCCTNSVEITVNQT